MTDQNNRIIPPQTLNYVLSGGGRIVTSVLNAGHFGFEWGVALFAVGIAVYFGLPFEPPLWLFLGLCFAILGVRAGVKRRFHDLVFLPTGALLFVLGLTCGGLHTALEDTPRLPSYERAYTVKGWVAAIEASGSRKRWRLAVHEIDGLSKDQMPTYIRTSVTGEGVRAGDTISVRAVLSAPPPPVVPGGYDPARAAYFKKIGGFGYSISKPDILPPLDLTGAEQLERSIVRMRYGLADRIIAAAPKNTAALQASLLTGIRTYIPQEQTESLRTAGLAHILAISGMHMGLLAGGVYYIATLMLACILPLSRRYDVRKPAAIIGASAATAYLIISGASVATQRAYIMGLIVFLAVILDRRALSIRSVAVAAAITLIWHPEALMSAGFQMSFSAVAALVVVYRYWDERRMRQRLGGFGRLKQAFVSLSVTSFVAGFATSGFAILHFNRMATYGLAGNLLAMPLFTFWVMPAAIAVFPALLIGQEHIPLAVMGKGLDGVLLVANWVSGWSGALAHIPAAPGWVIGLYGLAFTAVCLGPRLMRGLACLAIPICFAAWAMMSPPDMRVSQDGAVSFWAGGNEQTLYVDRRRADRYGREQFARRAGANNPDLALYERSVAKCDVMACRIELKGVIISVTANPSEILGECETADIVILTQRYSGPVARRQCRSTLLIDKRRLQKDGALNISLNADRTFTVTPSITEARRNRPWGQ